MTADQLRKAEKAYRASSRRSRELLEARDRMIREALDAGWTHAAIAEATGLTRGRIGQLAAR